MGNVDFKRMKWISEPKLYIQNEERLTIETEPFTFWRHTGQMKTGAEMQLPLSEHFIFTACTEFVYAHAFDQCGFILYNGDVQKAVFGTEKKDEECLRLGANVFYKDGGDRSMRDIGADLDRIYYRVIYRAGACRIQYSFTGARYTDLREFHVDPEDGLSAVSLYACSPLDSYFDCTFFDLNVSEDRMTEEMNDYDG